MSRSPHIQGTRVSKILETMAHVCGHAEGGISPILKFPITMTALVRYNPETTSYHESMIPQRERERFGMGDLGFGLVILSGKLAAGD